MRERYIGMFDNPIIAEIKRDIISSLPKGANLNELNIMDLWVKTSGVVTGFGGFITMPVAIPANVGSVIYVQMRMIACVAYMADYELDSDQTQTFIYSCLAGVAVNGLLKQAGIKIGVKFTNGLIKKIPGKVLTKINQKVGFRFITKFGTKGIVNLGKLLPGVGAIVGGGLDLVETKIIAERAYKWFFKGDFWVKDQNGEDMIEIDDIS